MDSTECIIPVPSWVLSTYLNQSSALLRNLPSFNASLKMRTALRLFASVKPGRFLEPGNPTGLTGLYTHPAPRSTLIALYTETLDRLGTLPEHSVYRQSAEAITHHRLKVIESVKPEGYEEWSKRAKEKLEKHPELFKRQASSEEGISVHDGRIAITRGTPSETDDREVEWDGERMVATPEGVRTQDERAYQRLLGGKEPSLGAASEAVTWEQEPPLEATQYA